MFSLTFLHQIFYQAMLSFKDLFKIVRVLLAALSVNRLKFSDLMCAPDADGLILVTV